MARFALRYAANRKAGIFLSIDDVPTYVLPKRINILFSTI